MSSMKDYQEDGSRIGIKFRVGHGDRTFLCFVSGEALQDHFNASDSLEKAFVSNRGLIESKALDKIIRGSLSSDSEVLVGTGDFR